MTYAQKARELAPENPAVADTLGWIYYLQGRYEPALVQLGAANNKEASAIREYHLAMAYLKAGKPELGRQSLNAALKMNPNLPEAQAARRAFGAFLNRAESLLLRSGKPVAEHVVFPQERQTAF